jgi:hypothetical protein
MFDVTRIGEGIDCFPAVEVDGVAISRAYLFGFCLNPLLLRMECIRRMMATTHRRRRRGLSAKCVTAKMRGHRKTVKRYRRAASQMEVPFESYAAHDRKVMAELRTRPSARATQMGFGRIG